MSVDLLSFTDYQLASSGEEMRVCCPYCAARGHGEDTKYHLYISIKQENYGAWKCHRCGARGYAIEKKQRVLSLASLPESRPKNVVPGTVDFPCETIQITEYTPVALSYLLRRGLSRADIIDYDLRIGTGLWRQRIFFPDYDEKGELIYWVARDTRPNARQKYLNPEEDKGNRVHYLKTVERNYDTVVVTEGPISAVRAGRNAVCVYGKNYSTEQVRQLVATNFKTYYIALDGDAIDLLIPLHQELISKGKDSRMIIFPYGDDPASIASFQDALAKAATTPYEAYKKKLENIDYSVSRGVAGKRTKSKKKEDMAATTFDIRKKLESANYRLGTHGNVKYLHR